MPRMTSVSILVVLWANTLAAQAPPPAPTDTGNVVGELNVNSRYTVESVEFLDKKNARGSQALRDEMQSVVGEKLNQDKLDRIARSIKREFGGRAVVQRVERGDQPDHVKVIFELVRRREDNPGVMVPRFVFHSKQNWTFGTDGTWNGDAGSLSFGILTDGDELIERYSGIRGGFERKIGEHVRVGFQAESFRAQWQPATQLALDTDNSDGPSVPGIYRTRLNLAPTVKIKAGPLTFGAGVSMQFLETQFPAARTESSNAAIATLRLSRSWENVGATRHQVDAGYSLRAATRSLSSDFVYARHVFDIRYEGGRRRESVVLGFTAGRITGRPPLFERFALGNSHTLRGYNKFDLDPLGGDRMAHGTAEYRFHGLRFVYDTGAAWRSTRNAQVRHSAGFGFIKDGITAVVAFPLREGRAEPIFMTGINF